MNRIRNPTTSDVVDYNLIEFLMRIDQNSGEVVWAKSYAFPSIPFALVYRKKLLFNKYFCTFRWLSKIISHIFENARIVNFKNLRCKNKRCIF